MWWLLESQAHIVTLLRQCHALNIASLDAELLIVGCGQRSQQLAGSLQRFLIEHQIPAEILDTVRRLAITCLWARFGLLIMSKPTLMGEHGFGPNQSKTRALCAQRIWHTQLQMGSGA